MKIVLNKNARDIYVDNVHIERDRLLFNFGLGVTHVLLVCGRIGDNFDINDGEVLAMLEKSDSERLSQGIEFGSMRVKLFGKGAIILGGGTLPTDSRYNCYSLFGCREGGLRNELSIAPPSSDRCSIAVLPTRLEYTLRRHSVQCRKLFRTVTIQSEYYILRLGRIPNYRDGSVYYKLGEFKYAVTSDMFDRDLYIRRGNDGSPPTLCTSDVGIELYNK